MAHETRHDDLPALEAQRLRLLLVLTRFAELRRGDLDGEVARLIREGNRIQAMKRHRELSGSGLKEARDAVEAIEARMRAERGLPDVRAPRSSAGASWGWLLAAAVAGGLALLFWRL